MFSPILMNLHGAIRLWSPSLRWGTQPYKEDSHSYLALMQTTSSGKGKSNIRTSVNAHSATLRVQFRNFVKETSKIEKPTDVGKQERCLNIPFRSNLGGNLKPWQHSVSAAHGVFKYFSKSRYSVFQMTAREWKFFKRYFVFFLQHNDSQSCGRLFFLICRSRRNFCFSDIQYGATTKTILLKRFSVS